VGRVRRQFLYNVVDVGNPATHYGQDGIMKPFVLAAGAQLQADIGRLANVRGGISKLCHVEQGRDLIVSKKKTGPEERNVEWGMLDMDPGPLVQSLWPTLQVLWDLETLHKAPTMEEVLGYIRELGLPMPSLGGSFGQVPQGFNPNPSAPYPSPYGQMPMMGPPPSMMPQGMPYQQMQMPMAPQGNPFPQQGGMPQMPMQQQGWGQAMPPAPPPVSSQPGQQYPMAQQQMPPPPPAMAPPPVMSQPGPSGYQQNPGGAPSPMAQGQGPLGPGQNSGAPF